MRPGKGGRVILAGYTREGADGGPRAKIHALPRRRPAPSARQAHTTAATKLTGTGLHIVDTPQALSTACRQLARSPVLGVDTEFVREQTYYARLGLIQLATADDTVLIDPLAIEDWQALGELLADPNIVKILHSGEEDLPLLAALDRRCVADPIFDTQIAAALAGYGMSLSYQQLVKQLCGIELAKGHARSDWLRRPLSDEQLEYAGADVIHLPRIHELLDERLRELGRLDWLREECRRLRDAALRPPDADDYYRRLRGAWRLSASSLAVLRELCRWRERTAQRDDRPRSWILEDNALLELAGRRPTERGELRKLLSRCSRRGKRYVDELQDVIDAGAAIPPEEYPSPPPAPPDPEQRSQIKRLKAIVRRRAEELDLPPPMLAQRRLLERLVQSPPGARLPEPLNGWRHAIIGRELQAELARAG